MGRGPDISDTEVSLSKESLNVGSAWGRQGLQDRSGIAHFSLPDGSEYLVSLAGEGSAAKIAVYADLAKAIRLQGAPVQGRDDRFQVTKTWKRNNEGKKCCEILVHSPKKPTVKPGPDDTTTSEPAQENRPVGKHALLAAQNLSILLEGVPGTGKTYAFGQICKELNIPETAEHRFVLNCHPSTQYEDVIEGLRPQAVRNNNPWLPVDGIGWTDANVGWHIVDGVFLRACRAARLAAMKDGKKTYVAILLDELNRANVPRMLGDLMTVMERSKRAKFDANGKLVHGQPSHTVTLPISGRTFLVPDNLIIVATMNSVDHSVAPLDQALLRRFWRVRVEPIGFEVENPSSDQKLKTDLRLTSERVVAAATDYRKLTDALLHAFGRDAMIGHSYLTDMQALCDAETDKAKHMNLVQSVWRYSIAPQVIAAVQAAGKEGWFAQDATLSGADAATHKKLVEAMQACGFKIEWTGSGAARALRMNPV